MTLFYSYAEHGFFDSGIHTVMPDDIVEISPAKRIEILEAVARGKLVERDENGAPLLRDPVRDQDAADRQAERDWRDAELSRIYWLRERHRDEQELKAETTLSTEQFNELLAYIQQLRDWPQSIQFPTAEHRPMRPQWVSSLESA